MTLLYAINFPFICPIMTPGTIIFSIFFTIMTHNLSFFPRLFSIMTGFLHPKNGNVQTAILGPYTEEWLISVDEGCLLNCNDWKARIDNGKQPDAVLEDYYTHYFYYYAHYFFGWPGFQLLKLCPTHCRSTCTDSVCHYKLREHQGSCHFRVRVKRQNC